VHARGGGLAEQSRSEPTPHALLRLRLLEAWLRHTWHCTYGRHAAHVFLRVFL
jgi:hypothetical protein